MAFTSGTASNYLDLLDKLKAFVTTTMTPAGERWSVLRWVPGPPAELVLQGPGTAGTDAIVVGIQSQPGVDFGNWKLRGFTAWNGALGFDAQYMQSAAYYASLMTASMPYWIVANGRRIVVVVKTSTYYEMMYLGWFLPYATPAQYPYPMLVSGSASYSGARWSESGRMHVVKAASYPPAGFFKPVTGWVTSFNVWPVSNYVSNTLRESPDGSYPLLPIVLNYLGELDGCFDVPGYGNAAENIVTVGGVDHLVVPHVGRTGYGDYWALRLA